MYSCNVNGKATLNDNISIYAGCYDFDILIDMCAFSNFVLDANDTWCTCMKDCTYSTCVFVCVSLALLQCSVMGYCGG